MGLVLTLGACAHKHGAGCKDGSCSMEKKKECGCSGTHGDAKASDAKPVEKPATK